MKLSNQNIYNLRGCKNVWGAACNSSRVKGFEIDIFQGLEFFRAEGFEFGILQGKRF